MLRSTPSKPNTSVNNFGKTLLNTGNENQSLTLNLLHIMQEMYVCITQIYEYNLHLGTPVTFHSAIPTYDDILFSNQESVLNKCKMLF